MHIDGVPNRSSRPTYLLRESYREGKKVRKRTLANLSALSDEQIDAIRAVLSGQSVRPVEELWQTTRSRSHGAVQAVHVAMQRLGFESLIASRPSPERDAVCAMVAARIVCPHTKLATTRWWHTTTLAEEYGVLETDETALYAAMDWLLERQSAIEKKLAARHLSEGALALYDLSSSYFEGNCCPLAKIGYSRDGKRNTPQVNYGLLTTRAGCPVAISVYEGQHGGREHAHAASQAAARAVWARALGARRGSGDDLAQGHRYLALARRARLDHGAQKLADPRPRTGWYAAVGSVR